MLAGTVEALEEHVCQLSEEMARKNQGHGTGFSLNGVRGEGEIGSPFGENAGGKPSCGERGSEADTGGS